MTKEEYRQLLAELGTPEEADAVIERMEEQLKDLMSGKDGTGLGRPGMPLQYPKAER